MNILIFEPDHTGHRLQHVRLLASAVAELGVRTTICLTKDAMSSSEFGVHLANLSTHIRVDVAGTNPKGRPLSIAFQKIELLRAAVRRLNPDHVFIPYADGLAQVLGATSAVGVNAIGANILIEALLMHGTFAYPSSRLRAAANSAALVATASSRFARVHWLDPLAFSEVRRRARTLADRSFLMPEPVEPMNIQPRAVARERLQIPQDGRYIGCVGGIDERKGMDLLLRAFDAAPLASTDRLLLVGKVSPGIRKILDSNDLRSARDGRVVVIDRYVSESELELSISALDVVAAPYPLHMGSSGIVVRAAAAGRPVLGSDFGWIGYVIPRFRLGLTCRVRVPTEFASKIVECLGDSHHAPSPEAVGFARYHTARNFGAHWTALLRGRLGLPSSSDEVEWHD